MIVQCIIGMVPFLFLFLLTVLMFAVVNFANTPKKERTTDMFKSALGKQYMAMYGDNFSAAGKV